MLEKHCQSHRIGSSETVHNYAANAQYSSIKPAAVTPSACFFSIVGKYAIGPLADVLPADVQDGDGVVSELKRPSNETLCAVTATLYDLTRNDVKATKYVTACVLFNKHFSSPLYIR
jgi:hypothetical protein